MALVIGSLAATFVIVSSGGPGVPDESPKEAKAVILRLNIELLRAHADELLGTQAEGARDLVDLTDEYIEAVKVRQSIIGRAEALDSLKLFIILHETAQEKGIKDCSECLQHLQEAADELGG